MNTDANNQSNQSTSQTILVVDDRPDNLRLLSDHLQNAGITICVAQDGESALERARLLRPDVILLDVLMPGMDGFETCRRLKAEEALRDIPVIFMTALTETREKVQGFAVGGVDYITKPFHADEVLARVTTQLRLRRLNRELEQELAERKRTEAELQRQTVLLHEANQELEAFSYTVSHDLNAPLRHIDGFIRIVLEESPAVLDTTMRKHLENAQAAAQRMKQMIETLLAFSRLTHQSIKKQIVSPDQLAQQAFAELAGDHKGRRVEVIMGALADTMADPQLLKLVFVNLLSNALKYTRPREVAQIEVGCTEREGEITYHVRDNGVGFDMRYAERIFAGFQRLHSQQDFEGTGVGLATVARIIRRHGGRIWVEAAIQQGATFYFTLGSGRARTEPPRTSDIGKAIK